MAKAKAKTRAKVGIDAKAAAKLEAVLRNGLTGSQAYIGEADDFKSKGKKKSTSVELDAATVARFANHLKSRLIASGGYIFDDEPKKKK